MSFMFITIISSLQLESYYWTWSLHQSRRSIILLCILSLEQVPGILTHDLICFLVWLLIIYAMVHWSASSLASCSVCRLAAPLHDYQFHSGCQHQPCYHLSETPQQLSRPCPLDESCLCLCCVVDPVVHRLVPRSVCCSVRPKCPVSVAHHRSLQCSSLEATHKSFDFMLTSFMLTGFLFESWLSSSGLSKHHLFTLVAFLAPCSVPS